MILMTRRKFPSHRRIIFKTQLNGLVFRVRNICVYNLKSEKEFLSRAVNEKINPTREKNCVTWLSKLETLLLLLGTYFFAQ